MAVTTIDRLLGFRPKELWHRLPNVMTVQFDDGESLELPSSQVLMSRYHWEPKLHWNRRYPQMPLKVTSTMLIPSYYPKKDGHRVIAESFFKQLMEQMPLTDYDTLAIDWLKELIHACITWASTEFIEMTHEVYTCGMSTRDFYKLYDKGELKQLRNCGTDSSSILDLGERLTKQWLSDPDLVDNLALHTIRCGAARITQFHHCFVLRGSSQDTSGRVFGSVMTNYYIGIYTANQLWRTSRDPVIANDQAGKPISMSEYMARRLKIYYERSLRKVVPGDCGSTHYLSYFIKPKSEDNNGDLETMIGMVYKAPEGLRTIRKTDVHLIGQTVYIRSPITCILGNHEICSCCMGNLSYNLPHKVLPSFVLTTEQTAIITQFALSYKHQLGFGKHMSLIDVANISYWLELQDGNNFFLLKFKQGYTAMRFKQGNLRNANDIMTIDEKNLPWFDTMQLGGIEQVVFEHRGDDDTLIKEEVVTIGSRQLKAYITNDLMTYMRENGFNSDGVETYVDLRDWDHDRMIFSSQKKIAAPLSAVSALEDILEGKEGETNKLSPWFRNKTVLELGMDIHEFFNQGRKFSNLSISLLLARGLSAVSPYLIKPAKGDPNAPIVTPMTLVTGGSISSAMGYENHNANMSHAGFHIGGNKSNSPRDILFVPDLVKLPDYRQ